MATLLRAALWLLSWPYRGVMALRRWWYLAAGRRVEVPVVSVGNLTVGGTGKTPLVAFLARRLVQSAQRPAIVSRGYGRPTGGVGDETAALRSELPETVIQVEAPNRYGAILDLLRDRAVSVILLDDGFQHLRLRRDLDILAIDATNPFGYGHLLPRGLLREPIGQVRRAGVVVITRYDLVEPAALEQIEGRIRSHLRKGALLLHASHQPTGFCPKGATAAMAAESLAGQSVLAFCGLGNPQAFYSTLRRLGADVRATRDYPDHHPYTTSDVDDLLTEARQLGVRYVVTTTKDYAKVAADNMAKLWPEGDDQPTLGALRIEIAFRQGADCLDPALRMLVGRPPGKKRSMGRGSGQSKCPK